MRNDEHRVLAQLLEQRLGVVQEEEIGVEEGDAIDLGLACEHVEAHAGLGRLRVLGLAPERLDAGKVRI